ncbi:MAG: DNA polymerase/3'-5' exonuclease PolX [Planctomycetota bacterium]
MPTHNSDVVEQLNAIADLLELKGANEFRIRAYRNAGRTVAALPRRLEAMLADGEDLSALEGIGDDLAGKIETLVRTGDLQQLRDLKNEIDPGLLEVLEVPSLGPKRTRRLADELGIAGLEDLRAAAEEQEIRALDGFGETLETTILDELDRMRDRPDRVAYAEAEERVEPLIAYLEALDGAGEVTVAGSYRRHKETVGDVDVLVTSNANTKVMEGFAAYEDVEEVLSQGKTRSSVRLRGGLQVDLRVVPKKSYGAAMLYFTGSKAHNIKLRKRAQQRDLKINEYGLFDGDTPKAGITEKELYAALDLAFVPPELREDRGEVKAAADDRLPELVRRKDVRGELHAHTRASDGKETLQAMIDGARERGYAYLAITDHSEHVGVTQGLDADGIRKQAQAIRSRSDELEDFDVLAGVEVDIREDGSLALPDEALRDLDLVIASVHTGFGLSRKRQTRRIRSAMEHTCVHALGHPTGRLLGRRDGYDVDLDDLLRAAADQNWALELNGQPSRLDLDDVHCQQARDRGVRILLGADAHHVGDLDNVRFGIGQARRGWLEAKDILNTRTRPDLLEAINRT